MSNTNTICLKSETMDSNDDNMSELCDESRNSQTFKSAFKRTIRESIDEMESDVNFVKKLKTDEPMLTTDCLRIYFENELKRIQESYLEHILELFFLERNGNMMDFQNWRKKTPNQQLLQYLRSNAVDSDEELKELIDLKTSIDFSSAKLSENSLALQVLQSTATVIQSSVTSPSMTSSQIPIASSYNIKSSVSAQSTQLSITTTSMTSTNVMTTQTLTTTTIPTLTRLNSSEKGVTGSRVSSRQHSIASFYDSSLGSQEQIVERAKQEAYVMQRISELRKNGLWSSRRLPKVQEPLRCKVHWDYLLEEMQWLAADFAQERKWKKASAKKCARMVVKFHSDKKCHAERAEKEELQRLKKIASNISKQIKAFWSDIEKVFEAKQEVKLKEKRKKLHDMHLNFIVDKADKYTERLTQELGKSLNSIEDSDLGLNSSLQESHDSEFEPENSESDDEETIAKEEEEVNVTDRNREIELLKRESEMPLEDLKASLPQEIFDTPATLGVDDDEYDDKISTNDEDLEFKIEAESIDEEDDEQTMEEQEEKEGSVDHSNELKELESDANLSIEELLKKYQSIDQNLDSDDETDEDNDDSDDNEELDDMNETEEDFDEDMSTEEENGEIGVEFLINPDANESLSKPLIEEMTKGSDTKNTVGPNKEITDIAAGAESLQPKGNTLSAVQVCTKVPFLLKHQLREYQHIGLDWLVAMQDKKLNGILADEMGLGKTIQTIALIAHLACEKGIWGPHLIVVPTSVMLNWEMEFKKWCPAFKILTYYGSPKERKLKRQGWTKPNQFHVCITSYKLVIQDHQSFRRKKWKYLILDEAQHIKNFKSQRWQMLLNFNTSRRLLLTGTPLQNNLMELWSLMHFLMPNVFQSHKEFKDWFVNPVTGMVEGNNEFNEGLIRRLHKVLRPFLLRRLKCDVEKQLPKKYEHIIMTRLSKRQRFLYEEFMSLGKTKETLATGNFLSVINILMQLRKVCNHPNLFDPRPTVSPLMTEGLTYHTASLVTTALDYDPLKHINLKSLNLLLSELSFSLSAFAHHRIARFMTSPELIQEIDSAPEPPPRCPRGKIRLQIRTSTATMHSTTASSKSSNTPTYTSAPIGNRSAEQKFLITHNSGIHSQNSSPTSKLSTTTTSSDGNRVAIPLGRLVQTTAGQHILLRTSSGTPISSTLSPTTTIVRQNQLPQSPLRQIIVTRAVQPAVGVSNSQEQYVKCASITSASKALQKQNLILKQQNDRKEKLKFLSRINSRKCCATALYASDLIEVATINRSPKFLNKKTPFGCSVFNTGNGFLNCFLSPHSDNFRKDFWNFTNVLSHLIKTPEQIADDLSDILKRYVCIVPRVVAPQIRLHASHLPTSKKTEMDYLSSELSFHLSERFDVLKIPISQMRTQLPELRLIQYDCGKLQTLDKLLWDLKTGGHRVLIFTQMSRMLDIMEQFLNHHGHTYLRLDGTTKIEQRQALMERFNADKRIFCFILSTRSGGIGVNLTGADTVIFYDSDWNPTMDAQAQDRCHRIGQTRDVHIYRLISEMSVEENILKKAQQKKLLGSVAIEGGNFTTAFFKTNAIQELFGFEVPTNQPSITDISSADNTNELIGDAQLEQALGTVEEDNDVVAAKTARAEAAAELAEFDENIPIDIDTKEEEKSPEEEKIDELIEQLKPVEKYAMHLLEVFQESVSFEQLKQAEEEIEAQKKEWEYGRLQAEKEENDRLEAVLEDEKEPMLTCHRDDAYNEVFISYNGLEHMPIWAPPTPPQDENDLYIDYSLGFLYEQSLMPESQLPPIYIPKETNKRLRLDTTVARKQKIRKEEGFNIPRSLFDRPSTLIIKLRRELILQKLKGNAQSGADSAAIHRTLNALGSNCVLPQSNALPSQLLKTPQMFVSESIPTWAIHEDWAVLQVIQYFQDLPLNLTILSPGHVPNWDLVSDVINLISCNYRSPKLCKYHYEIAIVPREEGKAVTDTNSKQKQKKAKGIAGTPSIPAVTPSVSNVTKMEVKLSHSPSVNRPIKTSQLIAQDNNTSFSQICNQRFETIKQIANRRTPTLKPMFINPTGKNPKHVALLSENGINYETPLSPIQVALNRAERISREKQKVANEQQLAAAQRHQLHQLQVKQLQQQTPQIKAILTPNTNIPAAQHQLQQAISAKVAALNQATLSRVSNSGTILSNTISTTTSQLNLTKALSQVNVASLQSQTQHSLPQPILSQMSVSPQSIGSSVSNIDSVQQGIQQTCSVVSVAALTPQAQQKLIAAVTPAVNSMNNQNLTRLTTGSPQVYKQIFLRQQQQPQRQTQPQQIQIQSVHQTGKQLTTIGVNQQQPRFQISGTVTQQPIQHTQSLIATSSMKTSQPNIVTSLPLAVTMTGAQQQRIANTSTTTSKPNQQIITRTITTDPIQMAHILKRNQLVSQSSGNLPQTQILLQQSAPHQSQSSQTQQILQNPVTFVKTLSSPATLATQSLSIPITMTGMNIFTTPVTKVVSPTAANTSTTSSTSVPATHLRQIQVLQQKRTQTSTQALQQQVQAQQSGQQNQQKITSTTIAAQPKGLAQLQASPVGTFQILHQPSGSSQNIQSTKTMPTTVTVQQLQQALKQGLVMPHTIHVSQSPVTSISQSILQAVSQAKPSQTSLIETQPQSNPTAVAQIGANQQTLKHIQVVSAAQTQTTNVSQKSIIISGQPAIIQTTALPPQQQTVTFAIRAANQTNVAQQTPQTSEASTISVASLLPKDDHLKEDMDSDQSLDSNQSANQSVRQSPYATRQRNSKQ